MTGETGLHLLLARNHASLKLIFVATLSLAMLIPLAMVRSIIHERQAMQREAQNTISGRWGGMQSVGGLVALTEAPMILADPRGERTRTEWTAAISKELNIQADMKTEWRYLGIYQVPVYTVHLTLTGVIDWDKLSQEESTEQLLLWLPLCDVRGVRDISLLTLGETETSIEIEAKPLSVLTEAVSGLQFSVSAEDRSRLRRSGQSPYQLELTLAGSDSLSFLPLADTTEVALRADWPHPEFVGQFLPTAREIGALTSAHWKVLGLNRPFGAHWTLDQWPLQHIQQSGFGMRLETPVDAYQRTERAVKYGFLFIGLTFFTLFLFEVITSRALHPVPYMLTGAALAMFYLVLLALSEYLAFASAFGLAASLLLFTVTPYTATVLGKRRYGLMVGFMMTLTYALLYILVSAQHAALLLGSLSLLGAIAALMYLTRKIDWYGYGNKTSNNNQQEQSTPQ